ncbi:MAG: UvrD-helicase domain-containing protein, partial [Gemmatimonadaceae bacterium]
MSDVTPAGASRFTDEQIAAIIADNHLLIEAGAGSGKTTTLVEKIVYQLGAETAHGRRVAGPCTLDQIVAITFSNAAAADLKRKLRVRLRQEGARTGDARWAAMVYEVDRAPIGTIHGFCGGVLRQNALRLGLDPHFAVLEEHESASLRDECAREIMMTALGEMDATAIALTVASGLQGATSLVASVASDALRARAALDVWQHDGTARTSALATRIRDLATAWDAGEDQTVWQDTTDADATKLALWVLRAGCAARELMHQRCDAMGALDFDALISRTWDALDGDSSVLAALHAHLSWVFIDEFQDTDPAQLEIGYRLCGLDMESGATAGVPRLCIIGDPKQSIYRFRHADVSVWGKVVQRFAALGIDPVRLTRNFRSRAPIVGLVNATFDGLIGQGRQAVLDEGHEIPFVALRAHRDTPGDDGVVEIV